MKNIIAGIALSAVVSTMFVARVAGAEPKELSGVGATFPAAIYASWGSEYNKEKQVNVVYTPTGSGDGVKRIVAREVDFAGTDTPLTAEQLGNSDLMQFPTLVGGIVPAINLPGVKSGQLKLTGNVLALIFMGQITKWNDEAIAALNPTLKLGATPIKMIVRSDRSGTTAGFTRYLAGSHAEWTGTVGEGQEVKWPAGALTASGNEGVSRVLKKTPGGISYTSTNTVRKDNLVVAALRNKSGQYVLPTAGALLAAIRASALMQGDTYASLTNLEGREVWPIAEATFIVMEKQPRNPERARLALQFFYWAFMKGDEMASNTGFVALPAIMQSKVVASFQGVRDKSGKPVQFVNLFQM